MLTWKILMLMLSSEQARVSHAIRAESTPVPTNDPGTSSSRVLLNMHADHVADLFVPLGYAKLEERQSDTACAGIAQRHVGRGLFWRWPL